MSSQLKIERRVSSKIQRVVRSGNAIYEKQYITNEWDDDIVLIRQRARREIELIKLLASSDLFGERLGVVRIAESNPQAATLATHEIAGMSLGQFIHEGNNVETNLTPWFLAGRWLRQFQALNLDDFADDTISKRDPTDIVDYCELRLRSLADYAYQWPNDSTRNELLKTIEELRDRAEQAETKPVWVHADYAPGNLMWDARVLTPIDFAMVRAGTPLDDATYLIHRLEMHKIYRPWLRLPVAAIRRAILRGLGHPTAEQSAAYQMLMIKHKICRLHTYVRRPASSLKQSLHDRWVRAALRKQLQWAVTA